MPEEEFAAGEGEETQATEESVEEQQPGEYDFDDDLTEATSRPQAEEPPGDTGEPDAGVQDAEGAQDTEATELDQSLVSRAKQVGYQDKDIQALASNERLQQAVEYTEGAIRDAQARQQQQTQEQTSQQQTDQAQQPTISADQLRYKLDMDEEALLNMGYDKEFVDHYRKNMEGIADHYAQLSALQWQAMQSLHNDLQNLSQQHQQYQQQIEEQRAAQAAEEGERRFDEMVNGLGDEWSPIFGQGASAQLSQFQPEFQNRSRLYNAVYTLYSGYVNNGMQPPSEEELFNKALQMEFGNQHQQIAQRQAQKQASFASKQSLSRPHPAQGGPQDPEERAAERVERWFRERRNEGAFV